MPIYTKDDASKYGMNPSRFLSAWKSRTPWAADQPTGYHVATEISPSNGRMTFAIRDQYDAGGGTPIPTAS